MNISLNPEQFLTLYRSIATDEAPAAKEVKDKMDSILLEALRTVDDASNATKFSAWIKQEKEKVLELEDKLKSMNFSKRANARK